MYSITQEKTLLYDWVYLYGRGGGETDLKIDNF